LGTVLDEDGSVMVGSALRNERFRLVVWSSSMVDKVVVE